MKIIIREAQKDDMSDVISLIKELAEFEKEPNEVDIDSTVLVNDGFEENSYYLNFMEIFRIDDKTVLTQMTLITYFYQ